MLLEDMTLLSYPGRGWTQHSFDFFSRSHVYVIRRAHWHPMSPRHLLILTRDSNLYMFDVLNNTDVPEQFWRLSDKLRTGSSVNTLPPVSFACSLGKDARGWASCCVHFVHEDGGISVLCPVIPYSINLSAVQVRQMTSVVPSSNLSAQMWLNNLVPVPPVDRRGYLTAPFSGVCEPDKDMIGEPCPLLKDVVRGSGETRVDTDYDIFVGMHSSLGSVSPAVIVRTASSGRIDCFAMFKPVVPCFAESDAKLVGDIDEGYFHIDSIAVPNESSGLFMVQDSTKVCDFIVLQSKKVHLLHIDYSLPQKKDDDDEEQLPPPALYLELFNSVDSHFSGASIFSSPRAKSNVFIMMDSKDRNEVITCGMPSIQVLRALQLVPDQFRAKCASALVPILTDDFDSAPLSNLAQEMVAALTVFENRIHSLKELVDECNKRVSGVSQDDSIKIQLEEVTKKQLDLKKNIEELSWYSAFSQLRKQSIDDCTTELDKIQKRTELRQPVIEKWETMYKECPSLQDYETQILELTRKLKQVYDDLHMMDKLVNNLQSNSS